jgi:hypothetical protein
VGGGGFGEGCGAILFLISCRWHCSGWYSIHLLVRRYVGVAVTVDALGHGAFGAEAKSRGAAVASMGTVARFFPLCGAAGSFSGTGERYGCGCVPLRRLIRIAGDWEILR